MSSNREREVLNRGWMCIRKLWKNGTFQRRLIKVDRSTKLDRWANGQNG